MEGILVRRERPADRSSIHRLNQLAFGRPAEAELVDALRSAGAVLLSLVAVEQGGVVGHILFSPVTIDSALAVGLGPMAVQPGRQRAGIGSALIRASLEELRRAGHCAVVVLGHPGYYPRFGFVRASQHRIRWEHDCPEEAFMVLELRPGGLPAGGVVRFRPEFDGV